MLVADGVFQLKDMRNIGLSKERVSVAIRQKAIAQLGMVERMYTEAGGAFTVLQAKDPKPGSSLIPLWDTAFRDQQGKAANIKVGSSCGTVQPAGKNTCTLCRKDKWEDAILS